MNHKNSNISKFPMKKKLKLKTKKQILSFRSSGHDKPSNGVLAAADGLMLGRSARSAADGLMFSLFLSCSLFRN